MFDSAQQTPALSPAAPAAPVAIAPTPTDIHAALAAADSLVASVAADGEQAVDAVSAAVLAPTSSTLLPQEMQEVATPPAAVSQSPLPPTLPSIPDDSTMYSSLIDVLEKQSYLTPG